MDCDVFWTEEAILNVLSNAAAYTEQNGGITCKLLQEPQWTVLQVHNNGPVIPEGDYDRIFERFVQLEIGKKGDGIGLHLAKTVMSRQGGSLRVRAASDGNLFEFVFSESLGHDKLQDCKTGDNITATDKV